MKNAVSYYYNLSIDSFSSSNSNYYIKSGGETFMFYKTHKNIKEIIDVYKLFNNINSNYSLNDTVYRYFHKIILNKDNLPYTIIDNNYYILLKVSNISNDYISIYDVGNMINSSANNIFFDNQLLKESYSLMRFDWENLWKNKIDYIEYQLVHLGVQYNSILPIVHYFIGMGENAIYYVNRVLKTISGDFSFDINKKVTLCHKRLCCDTKLFDFFNPFNIVIDHYSRDVAEYLKSAFINDSYDFNTIEVFISELPFSSVDFNLLFARLLFPSFFLDLYIDGINSGNFDILLSIRGRFLEYQLFLKTIYSIIAKRAQLFKVDWLVK